MSFVNSQTCEGYTALMLTIIWGSAKCFSLLLNFGGSDLSLRDCRHADVFSHAVSYQRQQFLDVLTRFRAQGAAMLPVNTAALQESASLDRLLLKNEEGELVSGEEGEVTESPNWNRLQQSRVKQIEAWRAQQEQIIRRNQEQMAKLA